MTLNGLRIIKMAPETSGLNICIFTVRVSPERYLRTSPMNPGNNNIKERKELQKARYTYFTEMDIELWAEKPFGEK